MLVKYVRNRKNQPVGCIVATDATHIGWSLCKLSRGDVFNKAKAKLIAENRAISGVDVEDVPFTLLCEFQNMIERAQRYFKGAST